MRLRIIPPYTQNWDHIKRLADPRPDMYSIIRLDPISFHTAYCHRDNAYQSYTALKSHGLSCAIVWHGLIVRQC